MGNKPLGAIKHLVPIAAVLAAAMIGTGCSQEGTSGGAADGADSVAYYAAVEMEDEAARLAALQTLQEEFPESPYADRAYARIVPLTREHHPERVESILQEILDAEIEEAAVYNAVGWPLAEDAEHLDLAVPILDKAVTLARAEDDTLGLAASLDSYAWALHQDGRSEEAVAPMEEAYGIYGSEYDEITRHMAMIYDDAGRDEDALPLYVSLLGHSASPMIRERLEGVVGETGRSMEEVEKQIRAQRIAGMTPAPELVFPSLADATPVSLADHRGKVVLVNFWHPT
ncbi:MAG: tetratricopeptide repeat protein [Candidatus Eisenbacteria bacterium]|nr:tetratricopeptide repeat protein [Candidatus Latescibacterota bacterium]MBD3302112.1 tetratricopeptide repeat protein [Candidatus Eisenbacteria bacterium]